MASVKSKIAAEFEEKRRIAQMRARDLRVATYKKYPELEQIDKLSTTVATDYTKRMLAGEDVRSEMQSALADIAAKRDKMYALCGLSRDPFAPKYDCSLCDDTGLVDGKLCRCFKKRVIEENFKNSNLGTFLENQSFESFKLDYYPEKMTVKNLELQPRKTMKETFNKCVRFADRFDEAQKSLLLCGGTGLGKTFLSTCIAKELLKKGLSVIYISAVDFFKRIEQGRFDAANNDVELFENCDLLIIDDLGTEAPSAYATSVFSDILDKRVMRGKKMIISTNSRPTELKSMYGQRVFSRIMGYFECFLFYGDDIRIKNR